LTLPPYSSSSPPSQAAAVVCTSNAHTCSLRHRRDNLLDNEDQQGYYKPLVNFSIGKEPAASCREAIVR
jgi:hypothetical protein